MLMAKLFAKPANVLVLDEPTNDLDAETLELLEERLIEFEGTLLVVSHDRALLNNVVTSTLAFEPEGVREYVGGYDDWLRQRTSPDEQPAAQPKQEPTKSAPPPRTAARKLAYKERRELEALPAQIEELEARLTELHAAMATPEFYRGAPSEIAAATAETSEVQQELQRAYLRWEELESLA